MTSRRTGTFSISNSRDTMPPVPSPSVILSAAPPPEALTMAGVSAVVLLTLFAILAASIGVFWSLVWRETANRRSVAVTEWARAAGFKRRVPGKLPPVLGKFGDNVRLVEALRHPRLSILRFSVGDPAAQAPPAGDASRQTRWRHALVWAIEVDWPAVGLRPAHGVDALVDLLRLPVQAAQTTQRFVVCTADRKAGRTVGGSALRGLLPADIGLILIGRNLVLDFSDRPFDEIEFNRMIAVAEQVAAHLPVR